MKKIQEKSFTELMEEHTISFSLTILFIVIISKIMRLFKMDKETDFDVDLYVGVCLWVIAIVLAGMMYVLVSTGYCF